MKKKIIIIIIFLVLVIFASRNVYERALGRSVGDEQRKFSVENFRGESVNISAEQNIETQTELSFTATENSTVYDLMKKLKDEGKINFMAENYIGMGKLIVAIGGVKSGGEKTWIYYVNGKKAAVGVSNYKINPGDVVSWRYENLSAY